MLTTLHIHNFTLVDQLQIELHSGLTAITGETGTGKSLVLDALALALGDRAETSRIRQGSEKAEITAYFDLSSNPEALNWLAENEFSLEESDECLLRRSFSKDGRSRGSINGFPATMQQLRTLGEMLVDIHSQHEHQSLLRKETHRTLLDNFAGAANLAAEVENKYNAWHGLAKRLATLEAQADELNARRDLLDFQIQELDRIGLKKGDLEILEQQQLMLSNAEALQQSSFQVLQLLSEQENFNVEQLLRSALHSLESSATMAPALESARQLLDSALIEVQEANTNIQNHLDSFDADPEKLAEIDEQLATIYQLARKHKVLPLDLPAKHQELKQQLDELTGGNANAETLRKTLEQTGLNYEKAAQSLTQARAKAAKAFAEKVNTQLQNLAMAGASVKFNLTNNPENSYSRFGQEMIELQVSTNPGQPFGSLAKIASGGELSRISLAIQVVAAEKSQIPTLIFDEVDVGVGGATAGVVGGLLRQLGNTGQVICVTHLPQVASAAHQQLVAEKSVGKSSAESRLKPLSEQERVSEVARMLSSGKPGEQALKHAREMIEAAGR